MFVVTKRVFLNVLTQLMSAQDLIDANYYIADQESKDGNSGYTTREEYYYNEHGELCTKPYVVRSGNSNLTPYHVTYGTGILDPTKRNSQILTEAEGVTPFESYSRFIQQNECLLDTYSFLYEKKPVGNGLRFLIFTKDTALPFIHIACEYISKYFGEDLVFVDREYRTDIPGLPNYVGDREFASRVFPKIREYKTIRDIETLVSDYQFNMRDRANIETYFSVMTTEQLFHIHEILFPHDPLQPGNYTQDQMAYIVTEKLLARAPRMVPDALSIEDLSGLYGGVSDEELMSLQG